MSTLKRQKTTKVLSSCRRLPCVCKGLLSAVVFLRATDALRSTFLTSLAAWGRVRLVGQAPSTFDTMLAYIRDTTTTIGLSVKAFLPEGVYETGRWVSDAETEKLNMERHAVCPDWNYTIRPRSDSPSDTRAQRQIGKLFLAGP